MRLGARQWLTEQLPNWMTNKQEDKQTDRQTWNEDTWGREVRETRREEGGERKSYKAVSDVLLPVGPPAQEEKSSLEVQHDDWSPEAKKHSRQQTKQMNN